MFHFKYSKSKEFVSLMNNLFSSRKYSVMAIFIIYDFFIQYQLIMNGMCAFMGYKMIPNNVIVHDFFVFLS